MDSRHFDALAKVISGEGGSRREALRLAIGGGLAALLGSLADEDTEAAKRRRHGPGRRRRRRKNKKDPPPAGPTCGATNAACNRNQPGACCTGVCCRDETSPTTGACLGAGGSCCPSSLTGGQCAAQAPQCCGADECCAAQGSSGNSVCCQNPQTGAGTCCPAGSTCDFNRTNPCVLPAGLTATESQSGGGSKRIRAGN
jgi:hypothetical protein